MSKFPKVKEAFLSLDEEKTVSAVKEELENGSSPRDIFNCLTEAMTEIGHQFEMMQMFMPEVMLATDAMKAAFEILEPEMVKSNEEMEKMGTIIIGTVKGDVHNVGKDMVVGVLTTNGFSVIDLGVDVAPSAFLETAEKEKADIIAASALMTATMPVQKDLIDFLEAKGLRDKYKVIVGGGVVTEDWANEIGADGYGKDAIDAAKVAKQLMGK